MKIPAVALASMLVLIARGNPNYQTSTHPHEQTGFYDSFPIEKPVAIPPAVSTLILETDDAKFVKSFNLEPEELMEASEIHLGPNNEIHLFVRGIIPLSAADHGWAWIIRHPYKNPEIILFAGGAGFRFLTTKSHGYRDFFAGLTLGSGFTISDSYRFNGSEYTLWKHSTQEPDETFFSASIPFDHQVKVPEAVSNLIFDTDKAKPIVQRHTAEAKHPDQLLEAAEIHLGPNNEIDLFVRGIGPLSGPNNAWNWIWIVRSPNKNPKILLYAGGDNFNFPGPRSHGYCDLVTDWETDSGARVGNIYRFNGSVYKLWKHREGDVNLPEP